MIQESSWRILDGLERLRSSTYWLEPSITKCLIINRVPEGFVAVRETDRSMRRAALECSPEPYFQKKRAENGMRRGSSSPFQAGMMNKVRLHSSGNPIAE